MSRFRLSRRAVLRGLGGVCIGLPFLEAMSPPRGARASTGTKRFIVFFTGNGHPDDTWYPSMNGQELILSEILAPLESYKQHLLVLAGVDNVAGVVGLGDGHSSGMGTMLTGHPLPPGPYPCGGGCDEQIGFPPGPSVDQVIAEQIGTTTKLKSLELGVDTENMAPPWNRMSFTASGQPLPPENSPVQAFQRLFTDVMPGGDTTAIDKLRAERKTVLDAVVDDISSLQGRLGKEDRVRLDQHLTNVREMAAKLDQTTGPAAGCVVPNAPTATGDFAETGRLHMDLIAHALQCDLTRVASLMWSTATGDVSFAWLTGSSEGHHAMSHNLGLIAELTAISRWYAEQLAYLLGKLTTLQDASGPLIDNTVVLWCSEIGEGNSHSKLQQKYVIAGSGGGYFDTGRLVVMPQGSQPGYQPDNSANDLMMSLCHAMDVNVSSFGDPALGTGKPLPGLTG